MKVIIRRAGKVGTSIAKHLVSQKNDVTVIDQSLDLISEIREKLDLNTIIGSASNPSILKKAGADETDMIIAVTLHDEINMVACQMAQTFFKIPRKIARLRSEDFLNKWEPEKDPNYYSKTNFNQRVKWAKKNFNSKKVIHLFIFLRSNNHLVGGITLDNIRYGPFQSATLGYWLGEEFSKQGIMTESLISLIRYADKDLGISRIEAAALSNNFASRRLLEKCNFKYEGVGQYFLQIKGKWEHHILYANICDSRKIRLKN